MRTRSKYKKPPKARENAGNQARWFNYQETSLISNMTHNRNAEVAIFNWSTPGIHWFLFYPRSTIVNSLENSRHSFNQSDENIGSRHEERSRARKVFWQRYLV